jgi:hypothetical protein
MSFITIYNDGKISPHSPLLQNLDNILSKTCLKWSNGIYINYILVCSPFKDIEEIVSSITMITNYLNDNNIRWSGDIVPFYDLDNRHGHLIINNNHINQVFVNRDGSSICHTFQLGKSNKLE